MASAEVLSEGESLAEAAVAVAVDNRRKAAEALAEAVTGKPEVTMSGTGLDDDVVDLLNASAGSASSQTVALLWQVVRILGRIETALTAKPGHETPAE